MLLNAFALGFGLSMDAVAVSISAAMARPDERFARSLRMPLAFGAFQALMPLIGWFGGQRLGGWVSAWAAWLACALLVGIGGKMLWEAWRGGDDDAAGSDPFAWRPLLVLALATSIDAVAAGVSLGLSGLGGTGIAATVGIVGALTAILCLPAVLLGRRLGERWAGRAEIVGGLVLIAIGAKVLVDHLRG